MTAHTLGKVAVVYPGNFEDRHRATPENNRLSSIFHALAGIGLHAEPAVYSDEFVEEVREQLMGVDAALVWMNPIQDGRDRTVIDAMLRDVSAAGIFVSAHPDVILQMGTKEVLYVTRSLGWGCDTHLYRTVEQLRRELPTRIASGKARILKQYRGNGGIGVWKIESPDKNCLPGPETVVRVRHAQRGSVEEEIRLNDFFIRCEQYFSAGGGLVDQAYQDRLPEGMIRCYLVHGEVVGFGHQAINALYPAPRGASPADAPEPGPRLYHPPTSPEFQTLKLTLEREWIAQMQAFLGIETERLPILWDCDFLLGPRQSSGKDSYVLCEINVSSVAPYPESAPPHVAEATLERIRALRKFHL